MKQTIDDEIWSDRLKTSELYYKEWSTHFKCDILEKYYEGTQWRSQGQLNYNPYVINKIFETIQIEIPQNERVYFKHVPAKTFRIGGLDHKYLSRCGWCGYYEFIDKDDLLSLPKLMNEDRISGAESIRGNEPNRESVRLDSERYSRN